MLTKADVQWNYLKDELIHRHSMTICRKQGCERGHLNISTCMKEKRLKTKKRVSGQSRFKSTSSYIHNKSTFF